uniref:Zinc finger protein RFP-like n=1 Tax=Podarcis muralis TaxID=64176 RepID=A0A670IRF5_PODMU
MAAAGGHIQCLGDEATCSICLDYLKDPVTIPECGHNFCRSCLAQCWGESEAEASCPQCRKRIQRRSLVCNWQLANVVEIAKNLGLQEGKEEGGKGGVCKKHQEPLKLFCKVHEAPICLVCDKSKEHENHKVIPLEEASEEYKGEICHRLEREEILAYQADLDKESKDLLKLTETERLKIVEKFRELRQFLEEQEKGLLNHMEEVEKEIAGRRDEQLARLSRKLSSLERIIQEMEEKRQQPASELLQDVRSPLQRYEKRENAELYKKHTQKANVTLDPDTAHLYLILSEDQKSVRWGGKPQALPDHPERFRCCFCVLGREGFTAGRHFWEVTVGSGGGSVGVARKSVRRKGCLPFRPEEGIWLVRNLGGKGMSLFFPRPSPDNPMILCWG